MQTNDLSVPLTEAEFHELDEFLLSLNSDEAMLDMSEFDGFITAVISGPDTIMPSTWLPVVWGGDDNAPEWDSLEAYERIFGLMIRHMNTTSSTLMEAPDDYEPCFLQREVDEKIYWVVDEWCVGYMKGVQLYPGGVADEPEMQNLLAPIRQFADEDGWDDLDGLSDDEIRHLQERIAPATRAIHAYWLERRHPAPAEPVPFVRVQAKVGRNEPCPCGSGRKYKRCCGAN